VIFFDVERRADFVKYLGFQQAVRVFDSELVAEVAWGAAGGYDKSV